MKKKKNLKNRWMIKNKSFKDRNLDLAHPVVRASYIWSILSDQLCDVLGPEVHHQWFKNVKPLVISDNVLILEVPNHFSAQWIHTYYHELTDILLSVMDKKLTSFFVSQTERVQQPNLKKLNLSKSSTSKVNC